ncbi:unnamed protein product [Lampetra planeri]
MMSAVQPMEPTGKGTVQGLRIWVPTYAEWGRLQVDDAGLAALAPPGKGGPICVNLPRQHRLSLRRTRGCSCGGDALAHPATSGGGPHCDEAG